MTNSEHENHAAKEFARAAEFAIDMTKKAMGIELRYDLKSLLWIDEIIEAINEVIKPKDPTRMVRLLGSFVGEVFRRVYKGRWEWSEEFQTWSVALPRKGKKDVNILPFMKVLKRFEYGEADSIGFYAKAIHDVVTGKI